MPTLKYRINLSVPTVVERSLERLAQRDEQSVAGKALELLMRAVEWEEDEVLLSLAEAREKRKTRFLSHVRAWK